MATNVGTCSLEITPIGTLPPDIDANTAYAAPDGLGFVALKSTGAGQQIFYLREWIEPELGPEFPAIFPASFIFSPNGRSFAYIADTGKGQVAVINGAVSTDIFEAISVEFHFSEDGSSWAYVAIRGTEIFLVRGGEAGQGVTLLPDDFQRGSLRMSPDGNRLAYVEGQAPQKKLIVNGQNVWEAEEIFGTAIFSPDSQRLAVAIGTSKGCFVVVDGTEYGPYKGIGTQTPLFSPDSRRVAWVVPQGMKSSYFVDGTETKTPYCYIQKGAFGFSPDGKRIAFAARPGLLGLKGCAVIDDVAGPVYTSLGLHPPVFSADSRHVAYMVATGLRTTFCVLDGQEGQRCQAFIDGTLALSPDGTIAAYIAQADKKPVIAVDRLNKPSLQVHSEGFHLIKTLGPSPVPFDDETTLRAVYLKDDRTIVVGRADLTGK